jgi:hypothetical protein
LQSLQKSQAPQKTTQQPQLSSSQKPQETSSTKEPKMIGIAINWQSSQKRKRENETTNKNTKPHS